VARIGSRDSEKPRRVIGVCRTGETPCSPPPTSWDSGALQRFLGQAEDLETVGMVAFRPEVPVADEDQAKLDRTLAGERLHELALAVAGYARNADDLAGLNLKIEAGDRRPPLVVLGEEPGDLTRHAALGRGRAGS
jgi:hypothetical protein